MFIESEIEAIREFVTNEELCDTIIKREEALTNVEIEPDSDYYEEIENMTDEEQERHYAKYISEQKEIIRNCDRWLIEYLQKEIDTL